MADAHCFLCSAPPVHQKKDEVSADLIITRKNNELDKKEGKYAEETLANTHLVAHLRRKHKVSHWFSLIYELQLLSEKSRGEVETDIASRRKKSSEKSTEKSKVLSIHLK